MISVVPGGTVQPTRLERVVRSVGAITHDRPMTTRQHPAHAIAAWLTTAEAGADDERSERALRDLLGLLLVPSPPVDFREAVMTASVRDGIVPTPSSRGWFQGPVRVAAWFAAALAVTVGGLVVVGPLVVRQMVRLLNLSVQGFVWIVGGLEGGLDAWSLLVEIGRALGTTLTTPQVSMSVVMIELVGAAALYALLRVLSLDRESM